MKILLIAAVLILSGCSGTMQAIALHHDRADPCQGEHASPERKRELGRPDNYKRPDYCFSAGPRTKPQRITGTDGRTLGYINK